jgi:hypothetical protein
MRRSFVPWAAALLLACAGAAGCEDVNPTDPSDPDPLPTVTDTFTGTLNRNGAATFSFTVQGAGGVTLVLSKVLPDNTVAVGLAMGTWNGTTCAIVAGLFNDNALEGASIIGQAGGAGQLCVRISDVGKIEDRIDFELSVVHP